MACNTKILRRSFPPNTTPRATPIKTTESSAVSRYAFTGFLSPASVSSVGTGR